MNYLNAFKADKSLTNKYGESNAYLVWVMGLYLDYPNIIELASECLTDHSDDKKIDFIKLDLDNKKIVFAQGYYSNKKVDSAPSNKASDLNTASAWLISGDAQHIPSRLREIIMDCRKAIEDGEVDQIDLLYVHNLPESVSTLRELKTVADHLNNSLPKDRNIIVIFRELGSKETEDLFNEQASQIIITDRVECPAEIQFEVKGPNWSSGILSIPGSWLKDQFLKYGDKLFSANYRGFLGISKRKKINLGIKNTAEKEPLNFWAYNNGITILTLNYEKSKNKNTILTGLSIINGAQTTGSLGSLDSGIELTDVRVLSRIIKCNDRDTIENIIKFNNTQNKITTWDKFSNDSIQKRILEEFKNFGHNYNLKRGFSDSNSEIGIESVAQPLVALHGNYQEANRGKNDIFESDSLYKSAFEDAKARHILFAYCLARAVDERRLELKNKRDMLISLEEKQLTLLKNLRFKYFFISVFAKCLEVLLNKKLVIKQVGFNAEYAKAKNKTINELVLYLLPVVNMALTYLSTIINGKDLYEVLEEDNSVETISDQVGASIYAVLLASPPNEIITFRNILTTD